MVHAGKIEISRSFGDLQYKNKGMSAVPDVKVFELMPRDKFVLLGCDGFWGVFGPDDACTMAFSLMQAGHPPKHICNRLINEVRGCCQTSWLAFGRLLVIAWLQLPKHTYACKFTTVSTC